MDLNGWHSQIVVILVQKTECRGVGYTVGLIYSVTHMEKNHKETLQQLTMFFIPFDVHLASFVIIFALSSKSHLGISISCVFLKSPNQICMKKFVKCLGGKSVTP